MDDAIRIGGMELGHILEKQGNRCVIHTRRGGIFMFVYFWLADMFPKEKTDDFDPDIFKQQLKEALDTPDGWRQLRVEEAIHRLEMKLLARLRSDELAFYLRQRRAFYRKCYGIDNLDQDIFWRIIAKGGNTVGLPTALVNVMDQEIKEIAKRWISPEYIYKGGSEGRLREYWARKGISEGLRRLHEMKGFRIVDFLMEHIENSIRDGYCSIVDPRKKKGGKDVFDHPGILISLDKPLRKDHSLHAETEDDDDPTAHILRLKDKLGGFHLDDEIKASTKLEQIIQATLTERQQWLFRQVFAGDKTMKDLSEGDQRAYQRLRKFASDTQRMVTEAFEDDEIPPKKRKGRPKKKRLKGHG